MVVRHNREYDALLWSHRDSEFGGECGLGAELVRKARTTIMAAKMARQCKRELWLGLLGRAITLIEQCPEEARAALRASLGGAGEVV